MIVIDYKDRRPIYEQVVERFQDLIVKNVIRAGEQMPSVRSLAMELAINPNTIQKAYAELERRGFTYTVKGRGSFVSAREDFLEYTRKEVLESFRGDVGDAKDLQIPKNVLTEIIDQCYEGADSHSGPERLPENTDHSGDERKVLEEMDAFGKEEQILSETDASVNEEQQPEEERSRA